MEFFTADDVLSYSEANTPDDPVTVSLDDSIQDALTTMLAEDFDQLPVVSDQGVEGTVTYKTIARYVKSIDEPDVGEVSVKIALNTSPKFVEPEHDIFDLIDTFAEDDFVLIGDSDELVGILTRYDILYFIEYRVEPFLKIGEIEEALRHLFRSCCDDDLDQRIEETFSDRAEHDDGYDIPENLDRFSFDDYRMFMVRNIEQLPPRLSREQEMVESLLEDIRDTRNALFHFRSEAGEVDRDQLDLAHGYFTGIVRGL